MAKAGGTYNFALAAEPVSIEPVNIQESEGGQVAHQVFQGLVKYDVQPDGSMKTVPCIAASWSSNADATVWTFRLKHGVMFQPPVSREVTADDFVKDFDFVTDPANHSVVSYILAPVKGADASGYAKNGLTGVKALDNYTLRFTLNYPFAEFPVTLGHPVASAWPVDYMQKVGHNAFKDKPVGTGPFLVQKWVLNQYIDLVKNPDYWDAASGGPYLDKIHFPILVDTSAQWLTFQTGATDYTGVPAGNVKAAEDMPKAKDGTWTARVWPTLSLLYVGFNMNDPVVGGSQGLPLRQALSYAADYNAVNNIVFEGVPLPPRGLVPTGVPGSDLSQLAYPYDPQKARELVAKTPSVPKLNYWYGTGDWDAKQGAALQAGWTAAGLGVSLSNYEWGTYITKLQQNKGQMYSFGWIADYPSMDNFLYPLFTSSQSGVTTCTFYKNPQVDQLIAQARGTVDEQKRLDLYAQAEKLILQDAPIIPMSFGGSFRVTNNRIGGFVLTPMGWVDMWKLWVK